jgi:hypothetical protein
MRNLQHRLSDIEMVEYAQHLTTTQDRSLRRVTDDDRRDAVVYEDRHSGTRCSVPRKFINALGIKTAFELVTLDPRELVPRTE